MNIWVTRDERTDGPLSTALRARGLAVVLEPVIGRRVVDDCAERIAALSADDWLVLTSPYAVEAVAIEPARTPHVAVVGDASRTAAEARGFRVTLTAASRDGAGLFAELRRRVSSGTVCYPRSSLADPPGPWDGVRIESPVLYETAARDFDPAVVDRIDVVTVASPSAVRAIGRIDKPFASIGPTTTAALGELGISPWVIAAERSFTSLAAAIADQASDSRHQRA